MSGKRKLNNKFAKSSLEGALTEEECQIRGYSCQGEGEKKRYFKRDNSYFRALEYGVERSYEELYAYYQMVSLCGNVKASSLTLSQGGYFLTGNERQEFLTFVVRVKRKFSRWELRVRGLGINLNMIRDIIADDFSFRQIESRYKMRHGMALRSFIRALELW